jgi:hypothetical protein
MLTMLTRVFSGCCKGARGVKFRYSAGAGLCLPAAQVSRPAKQFNAPRRHRIYDGTI